MSIDIPVVEVVFGSVTPPQGDIVDLRVHLGCTKEVSSFECLLQNWDKKYSPGGSYPINLAAATTVKIGRGGNKPLIVTGRVEDLGYESIEPQHYLRVTGRCVGEKLFRRVVTKIYENQKGEAIVKDLLDNFAGLSHIRDSTELVETTDTTYTLLEYDNTPVWNILKYIAGSADKSGVVGFDFRVAPDAKFEFFPRNSKTSPVSLSDLIEQGEYRKDIHGVRNKITVFGAKARIFPDNLDSWTDSLDGWIADEGKPPQLNSLNKRKGSYSILAEALNDGYNTCIRRAFSALKDYEKFCFWVNPSGSRTLAQVRLLAPNMAHYFYANMEPMNPAQWNYKEFLLGRKNEYDVDNNPNGPWQKYGSPKWNDIWGVQFKINFSLVNLTVSYDGDMGFLNAPFTNTQQDSGSQSAYGLRELVEVDEELYSDNECMLRAKALLNYLKDPAEYLTVRSTVIDYSNTPLLPGDKGQITLPNENITNQYFRILSVEYRVDAKTQTLEITLELGRETPLLADYLYALRAKTDHLSRHKIAR